MAGDGSEIWRQRRRELRERRRRRARLRLAVAAAVALVAAAALAGSARGGSNAAAPRARVLLTAPRPPGSSPARLLTERRVQEVAVARAIARARPLPAPGSLPQTAALPASASQAFRVRMAALWRGIVTGTVGPARAAFFPELAYIRLKAIADPAADYEGRLIGNYRADIRSAHALVGGAAAGARLVEVTVPDDWAWIPPGACYNSIGYWHAAGARIVYREHGQLRSFGIYSLISWRGEWYVVHLGYYDQPGTVYRPAPGTGNPGLAGGC